tara:strand:- start:2854 stop:4302 length:1449 start_codon:yes stop_codon:yes gene_type:complete
MLSKIRKFSSSIFAKIFLIIVAIPFIFWGMGDVFSTGNKNTIAKIGKDKISTQEFINFVQSNELTKNEINEEIIQSLLYSFIGQKLIEKEIENYGINLSDKSLSLIIKNNKNFTKNNNFSRTEYEKFLLNNNVNAKIYETYISNENLRKQLFDLIGGGVLPTNFMVNNLYDKIYQERNIDLINLNDVYKKNLKISDDEINNHYNKNKNDFNYIYKTINYIKLNPKNVIGKDEFNDLYFEKIDEIDDAIVQGENINNIKEKYNLTSLKTESFNEKGEDLKSSNSDETYRKLIKKFSIINDSEPTILSEFENDYYIVELIKTESIQKDLTDISVKKKIISNLENIKKRKKISKMIADINSNNFLKKDFYTFSKKENASIKNINLKNLNDESNLKLDLVNQIYEAPTNKVIIISDLFLIDVFLVYIKEVKNKKISTDNKDYEKYFNLSKTEFVSNLYKSYDIYLKDKYEIDINFKVLDQIDNFFR